MMDITRDPLMVGCLAVLAMIVSALLGFSGATPGIVLLGGLALAGIAGHRRSVQEAAELEIVNVLRDDSGAKQ